MIFKPYFIILTFIAASITISCNSRDSSDSAEIVLSPVISEPIYINPDQLDSLAQTITDTIADIDNYIDTVDPEDKVIPSPITSWTQSDENNYQNALSSLRSIESELTISKAQINQKNQPNLSQSETSKMRSFISRSTDYEGQRKTIQNSINSSYRSRNAKLISQQLRASQNLQSSSAQLNRDISAFNPITKTEYKPAESKVIKSTVVTVPKPKPKEKIEKISKPEPIKKGTNSASMAKVKSDFVYLAEKICNDRESSAKSLLTDLFASKTFKSITIDDGENQPKKKDATSYSRELARSESKMRFQVTDIKLTDNMKIQAITIVEKKVGSSR